MRYYPNSVFADSNLLEELRRVGQALDFISADGLIEMHVEPRKVKNGLVAIADGVDWDPLSTGDKTPVWYDETSGTWKAFATGGGGGTDDQTAAEVPYDNGASGLTADNVQDAIDEFKAEYDAFAGTADDQTAEEVPVTNTNLLADVSDTQLALEALLNPKKYIWEFEDLFADIDTTKFKTHASGSSTIGFSSTAARFGVVEISTWTSASSVGLLRQGAPSTAIDTAGLLLGGGEITFETGVRIDNLWSGANTGQVRAGLMDEISGAPINGVHAQAEDASSVWKLYCRKAGASASDSSGNITVTTGWHHLKIVVNAAATSCSLYVDGTLAGTVTTEIPTAGMTWGGMFQKTAGTTAQTGGFDYFHFRQTLTTQRA